MPMPMSFNDLGPIVIADIGNSQVKLGLVKEVANQLERWEAFETFEGSRDFFRNLPVGKLYFSNVRPNFDPSYLIPNQKWKTISVESLLPKSPVVFSKELDIGCDRKLACIAAMKFMDQPLIVVTLGTATSLTFVHKNRCDFSVVWPGIGLSLKSIRKSTRIQKVEEFPKLFSRKPFTFPLSLEDSVQRGVVYSTVFSIEKWFEELSWKTAIKPNLILTGGFAESISPVLSQDHILEPNLTLLGMLNLITVK